MRLIVPALALACVASLPSAVAAPQFVNGLALDGDALDVSGGTDANNGRLGYFSDIHYDAKRKHWWGLSDRGPGGGALHYETRVQRFKVDIDEATGAIGNFKVLQTVIFRDESGNPLDGIAPNPSSVLGSAFDPEGFVIHPKSGRFLVSDEYGPSLYEFSREGIRLRVFEFPANLIPRDTRRELRRDDETPPGSAPIAVSRDLRSRRTARTCSPCCKAPCWTKRAAGSVTGSSSSHSTAASRVCLSYSRGRGISALLALNDHQFLVLERNNRGIGVGAEFSPPNKKLFKIDLDGAEDVSDETFDAATCPDGKVQKTGPFADLAANTLAALGNNVPEKWEGLAIGPILDDGSRLMLAGTDNDYSVTQNAGGAQFDVYFRVSDPDPYLGSIQCPLGAVTGCFSTTGGAPATLPSDGSYRLLPAVLHAYKVPASDLIGFVPAVPPIPGLP